MTLLHAHFHLRNQQAFQRLLSESAERSGNTSGGALSASGGKSWTKPSAISAMTSIINERDWLGRAVLHLACSSTEPSSAEYVRMLLAHPAINVNILDAESHWTPLHRALYNGNLAAALLLLQRSDVDTSIKDCEGYTAFDLYNSTIAGTKPTDSTPTGEYELFTWGANRNASLGLGDGDDRAYPEQVVVPRLEGTTDPGLFARFDPIAVQQFAMSKLHSAVVTSEPRANIRLCGFSSGGRLGPGQHSQYSLKPLNQLTQTIVTVGLGQDHTLAATKSGEVLSWGLNRFGQLGYVVETLHPGVEPIQSTPKKILGPLKKDVVVKGVAACRMASACWTANEVYTWGTNNGQLGYEKSNQGPQILPRLVAKVAQPVLSLALSDTAMACLLISQEVQLFWNSRHFKINFPQAFPSEISVYRPPQFVKDANVTKITTCNDTFAALSSNGELFTFTVPNPTETDAGKERTVVKPQRVWALRKQFSAVRDAALGADGSLIICTESGHVFVRTRNAKQSSSVTSKAFKFQRIPYIQRIVQVHANSTGSFAALRQEYHPEPIEVTGNTLAQDFGLIQPWLSQATHSGTIVDEIPGAILIDEEDEKEDAAISRDGEKLRMICRLFSTRSPQKPSPPFPFGADTEVQAGRFSFPIHAIIAASRSRVLHQLMKGGKLSGNGSPKANVTYHPATPKTHPRLVLTGTHPMAVLLFLDYMYTDNVVAVWDRRVSAYANSMLQSLGVDPLLIRSEMQALARVFEMNALLGALESHTKRLPAPSLAQDLRILSELNAYEGPNRADVVLQLADDQIRCHSVVLRARSSFFADFFQGDTWTRKRWDAGVITIQMTHLKRRTMDFVMRFIYCGGDKTFFSTIDFINTLDELIEFLFEVLSAANELLLDRLVTICSSILLHFATISNACYLLADATHYHAEHLVSSLQSYIAVNLELFLESQLLSDLPPPLIKELGTFIRSAQAMKSPVSRSSVLVTAAMEQHKEWLEQQDIPQTIISKVLKQRNSRSTVKSPKLLPRKDSATKIRTSPTVSSIPDDIFSMEEEMVPSMSLDSRVPPATPPRTASGWKGISSVPKADMKAIMAETAQSSQPNVPSVAEGTSRIYRPPQAERRKAQAPPPEPQAPQAPVSRSPGSPWRTQTPPQRPQIAPFPSLSNLSPAKQTPSPRPTPPTQSGLGPVFASARQQQQQSPSIRRTSSGSAWSLPPAQPIISPPSTTGGVSLVAIQQSQIEEGIVPTKPRRSLREIQEEEQDLQAEADFLKWWHEEEERVRLQTEAEAALLSTPSKKGGGGRKPKKASTNRTEAASSPGRGGAPQKRGTGRGRPRNKADAGH